MGKKSLIIVESPAKASTINKFLGDNFIVKSSTGHIRDLPPRRLGIDEEKDFEPQYIIMPGKQRIINDLKTSASKCDKIYLAPDPDREGEAIAWHLFEILGADKNKIKRVTFNEITKTAIQEAIKNPRDIDFDRVNSQQARRILDRLVGYKISPVLWSKVAKGLSAGRVQSVAVRLICEREAEIEAFNPEEYWTIDAKLKKKDNEKAFFLSRFDKIDGKKAEVTNEKDATEICEEAAKHPFVVSDIKARTKKRNPYAPFITSTLQQAAVNKLYWSAQKVMSVAQQLYEGLELGKAGHSGLITYMRTDSVRIADEARIQTEKYIAKTYGKEYVPSKPNIYKSKKSAQEAHEAIRPTDIDAAKEPENLKQYLSKDQFQLYKLIWNRFLASQMAQAQIATTTIIISAGKYDFKTTGSVVNFPGFTLVYEEEKEAKNKIPKVQKDEVLDMIKIIPEQHFTKPAPRYTEASLVKALEEVGIGRPSTYAPILQTIIRREYVVKEDRKFMPTLLGKVVTDLLVKNFSDIMDVQFTADMENRLDKIESGKSDWIKILHNFNKPFAKTLKQAQKNIKSIKSASQKTKINCDICGKTMVIKWSRNGEFLACSGYPLCKNTKEFTKNEQGEIEIAKPKETNEVCENCGSKMIIKKGRYGQFLACQAYPDCRNTKPMPTGVKCPNCDGDVVQKRSGRGKSFYGCSNYPKCTYTSRFLKKNKKDSDDAEGSAENEKDTESPSEE